jgi:hypothetical protein
MHKTFFKNIGKILFISLLILPFLFQRGTQTLGQTDTDCAYGGTLGSWSDSSLSSGSARPRMLGEVGLNFNSPIKENKTHSNVTITALDPLPAGLQISKSDIVYGSPIQGTNAWTRYSIIGTPTQAGTYRVGIKAESASCGNDTGYIDIEIFPASVSCTLTANSPITPGQSTVLSWTTTGGVSSGSISPAVMGAGNFSTSGNIQTLPLTQDTTFTLNIFSNTGQSGSCDTRVIVGSTSGSKLKFIKTVLDIPFVEYGIGSVTADALFSGNNFVIAGARCTTRPGGEGLWFVSEDGSTTTARQACVDADSGINSSPYQHGASSSFQIFPEWQSGGFIRENQVQGGNCLKWGVDVYDCIVTGPGAQKSVFYSPTGVPVSKSPLYTYNTRPVGLSGRVIAPSPAGGGDYHILSLPGWTLLGATSQPFQLGYRDFGISKGILYSISNFGVVKEEKKLVADESAGEEQRLFYSFDNSVKPSRLAVWEKPKSGSTTGPKVYIYNGTRLHKIINLPNTLSGKSFINTEYFGVWGPYIITPGLKSGEIDVYKDGVKVESVKMQSGFENIFRIVSSPKGYVLVVTGKTSYLYKIADSPSSPSVPVTPTTPGSPVGASCGNATGVLAELCKQYKEILRRTCLVAPNIAICQNQ